MNYGKSLKVILGLCVSDCKYSHERTTKVKTTSNELGRTFEFSDGTINGDKVALEKNLKERYHWMWDWSGKRETERGLQMIAEKVSNGDMPCHR